MRIVKALRKPFTDTSLRHMFASCRKLVPALKGWKFSVGNMHKNAGVTMYNAKHIQVARRMLHVFSTKEVINVLLHEIAHAVLPSGVCHGNRWVRLHKRFGGDGNEFCRIFHAPHQVYMCQCKRRLAYAPSKRKWCLECESLERPAHLLQKKYRCCKK